MGIKLKGGSVWGRVLSIILALVILGALGALGHTIANPKAKELTEFYILGLEGKAIDYPDELMVGEEGKVLMGIINREQELARAQQTDQPVGDQPDRCRPRQSEPGRPHRSDVFTHHLYVPLVFAAVGEISEIVDLVDLDPKNPAQHNVQCDRVRGGGQEPQMHGVSSRRPVPLHTDNGIGNAERRGHVPEVAGEEAAELARLGIQLVQPRLLEA